MKKEVVIVALIFVLAYALFKHVKTPKKSNKVTNVYMKSLPKNASFNDVIKYIILNFEGGYYHPDMLKDGRVKDKRFSNSGETLFGIDRLKGGDINETAAGRKFWAIVDNYDMRHNYKYNQFPNNENLFTLAGDIIKPEFEYLMKKYVVSDLRPLIYSNPLLLLNFVYATYNGSGWFQRFAEKINKAFLNGNHNADNLAKLFTDLRKNSTNSLIAQVGRKFENVNVV